MGGTVSKHKQWFYDLEHQGVVYTLMFKQYPKGYRYSGYYYLELPYGDDDDDDALVVEEDGVYSSYKVIRFTGYVESLHPNENPKKPYSKEIA